MTAHPRLERFAIAAAPRLVCVRDVERAVKITFSVRCEVEYVGDVTMTKKEYDEWSDRFDHSIGFAHDTLCHNLLEKAELDIGDPSTWGDLQLDRFEPVKPRKAKHRTAPEAGGKDA